VPEFLDETPDSFLVVPPGGDLDGHLFSAYREAKAPGSEIHGGIAESAVRFLACLERPVDVKLAEGFEGVSKLLLILNLLGVEDSMLIAAVTKQPERSLLAHLFLGKRGSQ
jgi:hypothetical protein